MNVSANTILNSVWPYVLCLCVGDGVTFYHYSSSELVFAVALFARYFSPLLFHEKLCAKSITQASLATIGWAHGVMMTIGCNALSDFFPAFCGCRFNLCILFCVTADHSFESRIPNENVCPRPKRTERSEIPKTMFKSIRFIWNKKRNKLNSTNTSKWNRFLRRYYIDTRIHFKQFPQTFVDWLQFVSLF